MSHFGGSPRSWEHSRYDTTMKGPISLLTEIVRERNAQFGNEKRKKCHKCGMENSVLRCPHCGAIRIHT